MCKSSLYPSLRGQSKISLERNFPVLWQLSQVTRINCLLESSDSFQPRWLPETSADLCERNGYCRLWVGEEILCPANKWRFQLAPGGVRLWGDSARLMALS